MLGVPVCTKCEQVCNYIERKGWRCPQCGLVGDKNALTIPKVLFDKLFPDVPLKREIADVA